MEYAKARDNADCVIIDTVVLAAAEYFRCVTVVGDNTDLIVLLLHKTKEIELNTAQQYFRTKKCTRTSLFLLHVLRKSRSWDTFSVSTRCLHATRLPGYLWRAKKFFGIPEADTKYWRLVTLFEDSNVPKAVEVASVIAT